MKVLIFSTVYFPFVGGAEVAIKEITDRLPNIEFDLITARLKSNLSAFERFGNVNIYRIGFGWGVFDKWWLAKWGGWKALMLHRRYHYNVTWAMMASWGGLASWWFHIILPKVPLVVTLQEGDEIAGRKWGLVSLGWRFILSRADKVTVISNYLGDLARTYGYKGLSSVIPNGVDVKNFQFSFSNFQKEELHRKIGIKSEDIVLITTSRLVEKNGVGDIIKSLQFLPPNVKLLIAGTGPLESELRIMNKELGMEKRVKMLGHVDHADLPKYLHASNIFVRPSLSEGLGNSFLEAMAAGLPIIGTPVGGIPDFLKNEETGLFCKAKNPKSIAEAVALLISDTALRKRLIENGKNLVRKNYTWESIVQKMSQVFNEAELK